jgi:hypothetical protein
VLVRVFDRIEDLRVCLAVIDRHWTGGAYYKLVVGNGQAAGFPIPEDVAAHADRVIELNANPGHRSGSSQLLLAGLDHVPDDCRHTILLEADTWIFTDAVLRRYMKLMDARQAVWAGAEWIEKHWSLALDAAVVRTSYAREHPGIFDFRAQAESWVAGYLLDDRQRFVTIREHMPVHRPRAMKTSYDVYGGRFRSFPAGQMVTHHIADLAHGLETKKEKANICLGRRVFDVGDDAEIAREHKRLRRVVALARVYPRSRWFKKKTRRP